MVRWILLSFAFAAWLGLVAAQGKEVVCYYGSWARYRQEHGKCTVEDLDPSLCTNLIYTFAGLDLDTHVIKSLDPYCDLEENWGLGSFKKATDFKKTNPGLKVTLAIGGWNEGSPKYSDMANNDQSRAAFVASIVPFLQQYGFDGLDMDWEYPTQRGGKPEDKQAFIRLLQDLKAVLSANGMILTAALSAGPNTIEPAYDIAAMGQALDYLHVMTYDYHGIWDPVTGPNSPISAAPGEMSIESTMKLYIDAGVPREKIILGIPLYGHTFLMNDASNPGFGVPSQGWSFAGPWTNQAGMMGYNEICLELKSGSWVEHWDETSKTPFLTKNDKFISYDNDKSIQEKVAYAKQLGLGGVMVWSLETDDIYNDCGNGKYYLMHVINQSLGRF